MYASPSFCSKWLKYRKHGLFQATSDFFSYWLIKKWDLLVFHVTATAELLTKHIVCTFRKQYRIVGETLLYLHVCFILLVRLLIFYFQIPICSIESLLCMCGYSFGQTTRLAFSNFVWFRYEHSESFVFIFCWIRTLLKFMQMLLKHCVLSLKMHRHHWLPNSLVQGL